MPKDKRYKSDYPVNPDPDAAGADNKYKRDGNDQYGRPKYKINNLDAYMKNPTKGVFTPLDIGFSLFGEQKVENGPLTESEKASRSKLNADAKEKGKYLKLAAMKAAEKAKAKPKPSNPMPSKPNYKEKYKTIPIKPNYKEKYKNLGYGKAVN